MIPIELSDELKKLIAIAREAGDAIMEIYARPFQTGVKQDLSPVTEADVAAENIILPALAKHWPDIPAISEEQASEGKTPTHNDTFFLVDPLDGTKEFISRNGEFTVNIALILEGAPMRGVVYAPAVKEMFAGEIGAGAFVERNGVWQPCRVRVTGNEGLAVVASRSHRDSATDEFLKSLKVASFKAAGSSLKFCRVAEGVADLYPRFGRTMEWDVAAGHAVLAAAGGSVTRADGARFGYGKPGYENPAFIAKGL